MGWECGENWRQVCGGEKLRERDNSEHISVDGIIMDLKEI
jgi:hypothetical protein